MPEKESVIYLGGRTDKMVTDKTDKPEEEKVEQVPIGYREEPEKAKGGWRALATPVLIALVISFAMGQFFFLPQMDVETNQAIADMKKTGDEVKALVTPMQTQITGIDNAIRSLNTESASLRGSLANYATSDRISSLQSSISAIQTDINSFKGSIPNVSAITAKIDGVQTSLDKLSAQVTADGVKITALETKVAALQSTSTSVSGGSGTTTGSGVVAYKLSMLDEGFATGADNSTMASFKLTVTNNTSADITDLIMSVTIYVDSMATPTSYTLSKSGDKSWAIRYSSGKTLEIRNTRADLLKGQSWKTYFDLKIQYATSVTDWQLEPEVGVASYN